MIDLERRLGMLHFLFLFLYDIICYTLQVFLLLIAICVFALLFFYILPCICLYFLFYRAYLCVHICFHVSHVYRRKSEPLPEIRIKAATTERRRRSSGSFIDKQWPQDEKLDR